jgi:hypothetical protein
MSITRVGPWALGDKLTSTQANNVDLNATYAVDKRSGQTDTLESVVTCSGAGRLIPTYEVGADADTTYALSSGISVINASSGLTANRAYTLSNTGAAQGDMVMVLGGATYDLTVKNNAGTTLIVLGTSNTGTNSSRWAQFLHNGSAWVLLSSSFAPIQQRQVFTVSGNYTVPADVYKLIVIGAGAGGGGGGGGAGAGTGVTSLSANGGGGGGAAMAGVHYVDTTPGAVIAVSLGGGGSAGAGSVGSGNGSNGGDGGDTTFGSILTFKGAQGGNGGYYFTGTNTGDKFSPGGGPIKGGVRAGSQSISATLSAPPVFIGSVVGVRLPGEGGYGASVGSAGSITGAGAAGNYPDVMGTTAGSGTTTPGTGGAQGAASGSQLGGGGGGGGGASRFGNGGNGGAGGAGNSGGQAPVPTVGSAGGVSAGGGGGGASGQGTGGIARDGANGGAGGDGVLIVIPIR